MSEKKSNDVSESFAKTWLEICDKVDLFTIENANQVARASNVRSHIYKNYKEERARLNELKKSKCPCSAQKATSTCGCEESDSNKNKENVTCLGMKIEGCPRSEKNREKVASTGAMNQSKITEIQNEMTTIEKSMKQISTDIKSNLISLAGYSAEDRINQMLDNCECKDEKSSAKVMSFNQAENISNLKKNITKLEKSLNSISKEVINLVQTIGGSEVSIPKKSKMNSAQSSSNISSVEDINKELSGRLQNLMEKWREQTDCLADANDFVETQLMGDPQSHSSERYTEEEIYYHEDQNENDYRREINVLTVTPLDDEEMYE